MTKFKFIVPVLLGAFASSAAHANIIDFEDLVDVNQAITEYTFNDISLSFEGFYLAEEGNDGAGFQTVRVGDNTVIQSDREFFGGKSISQRLTGEEVIGQSSISFNTAVSDLIFSVADYEFIRDERNENLDASISLFDQEGNLLRQVLLAEEFTSADAEVNVVNFTGISNIARVEFDTFDPIGVDTISFSSATGNGNGGDGNDNGDGGNLGNGDGGGSSGGTSVPAPAGMLLLPLAFAFTRWQRKASKA